VWEMEIAALVENFSFFFFLARKLTWRSVTVTEYLPGGSLHQFIHSNWESLERTPMLRLKIVTDIVKG
jgi:hypothetical protein